MAEEAEQVAIQEQQATSSEPLKWGDSFDRLSEERKTELAQRLWAWKPGTATQERPGPFAHEKINGLEVFWLAICAQAGVDGDVVATELAVRRAIHEGTTNALGFPTLY